MAYLGVAELGVADLGIALRCQPNPVNVNLIAAGEAGKQTGRSSCLPGSCGSLNGGSFDGSATGIDVHKTVSPDGLIRDKE